MSMKQRQSKLLHAGYLLCMTLSAELKCQEQPAVCIEQLQAEQQRLYAPGMRASCSHTNHQQIHHN
jgi:hypothetical protein